MSNEIVTEVLAAILSRQIPAWEIDAVQAKKVCEEAMRHFVLGSPRAWWMNLGVPAKTLSSTSSRLIDVVPDVKGRVWLIPETEQVELPVFDIEVQDVQVVLSECPFFEYYIVAKDYSWLVAESDHNQFYICRSGSSKGMS